MANAELSDKELVTQKLESIFMTSKKSVQEYVREIERRCRFQSSYRHLQNGTVLDDRGRLIDIYDACVQQDAHLRGVMETLFSQIVGERFMMASQNEKGKYTKDIAATRKIQNTEFLKIIRGIAESKLYGYTGLEFWLIQKQNVVVFRSTMWSVVISWQTKEKLCSVKVFGCHSGVLMTLNILTTMYLLTVVNWGCSRLSLL